MFRTVFMLLSSFGDITNNKLTFDVTNFNTVQSINKLKTFRTLTTIFKLKTDAIA